MLFVLAVFLFGNLSSCNCLPIYFADKLVEASSSGTGNSLSIPIDEDLFAEDDDLDELEEDLEKLGVQP